MGRRARAAARTRSRRDALGAAQRYPVRSHAGLRLAAALWRFWHDRGDRSEGARWLEAALHAAPEPAAARAAALHGLSVLALRISDQDRALAAATEAVAFSSRRRPPAGSARSSLTSAPWPGCSPITRARRAGAKPAGSSQTRLAWTRSAHQSFTRLA